MAKRLLGSMLFTVTLGALFFAAALMLSGNTGYAQKAGGAGSAAQSSQSQPKNQPRGVWEDVAPFPTVTISPTPGTYPLKLKRAGAAAYPPNGKMYVMGGRHGIDGEDVTLQWIWEYTPGTPGSWLRKTALLDGSQFGSRYTANMAVVTLTDTNGPRVYAIGGSSINSEITGTVRIYDPVADVVTRLTSDTWPASPPRIPGGYAVYNNKLYIFGGFSALGNGAVFNETWVFDPMGAAGQKWSQLPAANLGLARGYLAGAALDGYIYAIGGDTWDTGTHTLVPVTNVERLDPNAPSPSWTSRAALPTARGDLGAWAYDSTTNYEIAGRIAVAGGVYPTPDATGYLYDPGTDSWGAFPSLIHATRNYGVAQLDGYLYAFGGYDYTNGTPSGANFNQRYDATTPRFTPTNTVTGTPPTFTRTATPTHTSTAPTLTSTPTGGTATPCATQYSGSITTGDPTMTGRMFRDGIPSTCAAPKTCPGPFDTTPHHYDSYTLVNNTGTTACITVDIDPLTCVGTNYIFSSAYLGSFNPADMCQNYLADGGSSPDPSGTTSYSFNVPAGATFVVVVNEVNAGAGCAQYTMTLTGLVCGTPTNTPTGTPPTATRTPTPTATPCNYTSTTATATIEAGTTLVPGSQCDDCVNGVTIPFNFSFYGVNYTAANVSSNGNLQFVSTNTAFSNSCLPFSSFNEAIMPFWDDLRTDQNPTDGIYYSTSGAAPDRVFNIEWRAVMFSGGAPVNFEIRLHETTNRIEFIYGAMGDSGASATVGLQHGTGNPYREYECNTGGITQGLAIHWTYDCVPVITSTRTSTATSTTPPTFTATSTGQVTNTPTNTETPSATPTECTINFTDVHPGDYFYEDVRCVYCLGAVSGYADGTFRPFNNTTRGQMTKIIVIALDLHMITPTGTPTFRDVPTNNPFYVYIETAAASQIVSGYNCGGPGEPCPGLYFRPFADVTRGQLSKIVVVAANHEFGWLLLNPPTATFTDVPPGSAFYTYIETAVCHGVVSGYADGTFRPFNNAIRAQIAKIVCRTSQNPPSTCPEPTPVAVEPVSIVDYDFAPREITITVGSAILWTNDGEIPHTATSYQYLWDSELLASGEQYSRTFQAAGVFPYFCEPHPWMTGTIYVTDTLRRK